MIRLAANLSMMFGEHAFLERFRAARDCGFRGVEYLFPYEAPASTIAAALQDNGLTQVLFNFPGGNWSAGERGIAALPERTSEFRDGVGKALDYARATGCPRLHAMTGRAVSPASSTKQLETFVENLRFAADAVAIDGIDVMIEPINSRVDIPGYLLDTTAKAEWVLSAVDRPNVKIQYDIYHMQIMEGDLARTLERLLPRIGHVQLADNPGRNEPGTGEINYPWLLARLDALGYQGWVGCEYKPAGATRDGLAWAKPYLTAQENVR
ncbi:MAG: 2-oxo-tetronate isomerase [Gammaproteobacteria bacterium]